MVFVQQLAAQLLYQATRKQKLLPIQTSLSFPRNFTMKIEYVNFLFHGGTVAKWPFSVIPANFFLTFADNGRS